MTQTTKYLRQIIHFSNDKKYITYNYGVSIKKALMESRGKDFKKLDFSKNPENSLFKKVSLLKSAVKVYFRYKLIIILFYF